MDKQKAQRFAQFLVKKYGEDGAKKKIQQIQKTGKVDEEDLKEFTALEQKQTTKALHGAKLSYIRTLKNQCPEGQELVYYKKGGSVTCGCKKKEQGGEVPAAKCGAVAEFKKVRKGEGGFKNKKDSAKTARKITVLTSTAAGQQAAFNRAAKEKKQWSKEDDKKLLKYRIKGTSNSSEKKDSTNLQNKWNNLPESEKKKHELQEKRGGKVVKAFKEKCGSKLKKHLQGGSLNGIPFIKKALY